jgi:thioredoxin reductase (NADPH)
MFPSGWIPLESDAQARLPVCEFPDGTRMESPTIRQVIEKLAWVTNPSRAEYDLAIYGAGPARLSAALNGSSDGLRPFWWSDGRSAGRPASSPRIARRLGQPEAAVLDAGRTDSEGAMAVAFVQRYLASG